jgi:hypothetical protein
LAFAAYRANDVAAESTGEELELVDGVAVDFGVLDERVTFDLFPEIVLGTEAPALILALVGKIIKILIRSKVDRKY